MFEELIELITFEKLVFFFKEQSLKNSKINFSNQNEHEIILKKNILSISDSDILRQILPQEIAAQMFSGGQITLLAFVFALRHKIALLNILFHYASFFFTNKNMSSLQIEKINKRCNFSIEDLFQENKNLLNPIFWTKNYLPILGFSAVGCLYTIQSLNYCRAFDHYDIPFCKNKSEFIFCEDHVSEVFWFENFLKKGSTQAKMFEFYLKKENFNDFDETYLQKLMKDFFSKYKTYQHSHSFKIKNQTQDKINILLSFYNFLDITELRIAGIEELRSRFLEKAKTFHPDLGGSQELFKEARANYEQLRELI